MKARLVSVAFFVFATSVAACQILAGIGYVEKSKDSTDPIDGRAGDGAPVIPDPCDHKRPPGPPEVDDQRDSIGPIYLALRKATIGSKGGTATGFDLDGVCTCDKRPNTNEGGASTCKPPPTDASKPTDCDGDRGIDNGGAALFQSITGGLIDIDEVSDVNSSIADGKGGLLIYIEDYNGKLNDREVFAGAMRTYGIVDGQGCGTQQGMTPNKYKPGWCGDDRWSYSKNLVLDGTKIPLGRAKGWVNNGTLVFANDDKVTIFFGGATLSFASAITAGELSQNAEGKWQLKATMSGRIAATDLLRAIGSFNDPIEKGTFDDGGRKPFCLSGFFQTKVRNDLCGALDISSSVAFDMKGESCDAISSAVAFEAEQAQVGEQHNEPDDQNNCEPDSGFFRCGP